MDNDPATHRPPLGGHEPDSTFTAPFQAQISMQALIGEAAKEAAKAATREMADVVRELEAVMTEYPRVYPVQLVANVGNKFTTIDNPQSIRRFPFHGVYALDRLELLRSGGPLASQVEILTPFFNAPLVLSADKTSIDFGMADFGGMELQFTNLDPVNRALVLVRFKKVWSAEAWQRATR